MLQCLCNIFNQSCTALLELARHNNVASKVLRGKTLPYRYHISEVEESEMRQLKTQTIML